MRMDPRQADDEPGLRACASVGVNDMVDDQSNGIG
jgi:hypothetical protein